MTEYDFHIFEYCIVSKIFPAVIEERDCTSVGGFFPLLVSEQGFAGSLEMIAYLQQNCLHRLVLG